MKQYDSGIDLGTTSIIIATEEQGVVFRQPTIGAVDTRTNSILAVGDEALKMVGRAPAHIDLVRPLRDGIIQDHRMTNELIVRFVNQVCRSRIFKPRIAVCVPAAITGIEADAVVESVMAAGARQVYLVDEPVAAALGAGLQIRQPHGCMVVDIGGGSTDIAVISMGGRVKAASLPVAGNAFDSCIAQYVQEKYQIAILVKQGRDHHRIAKRSAILVVVDQFHHRRALLGHGIAQHRGLARLSLFAAQEPAIAANDLFA